jgi:hypothetical protein
MMQLGFDSKGMVVTHYGERGNFSNKSMLMDFPTKTFGKAAELVVLSKDILPVLSGLVDVEIEGIVTMSVTANCVDIAYSTELADYKVVVPGCALNGKRIKTAFEAYGG